MAAMIGLSESKTQNRVINGFSETEGCPLGSPKRNVGFWKGVRDRVGSFVARWLRSLPQAHDLLCITARMITVSPAFRPGHEREGSS